MRAQRWVLNEGFVVWQRETEDGGWVLFMLSCLEDTQRLISDLRKRPARDYLHLPKGTMYIYPSEFLFYRDEILSKYYFPEQSDDSFNDDNTNHYVFFTKFQRGPRVWVERGARYHHPDFLVGTNACPFLGIIFRPVLFRVEKNPPTSFLGKFTGRLSQSHFGSCASGWKAPVNVLFGRDG